MTSIAMKSRLNPFADAFVPSTRQENSCEGANVVSIVTMDENKMKTNSREVVVSKNLNDCKTLGKHEDIKIKLKIPYSNPSIWSEVFCSSFASLFGVFIKKAPSFIVAESILLTNSKLQMLPACSVTSDNLPQSGNQTDKDALKGLEMNKADECQCPPMFGWVIPHDFFGNPFKIKYNCQKKYAHISSFEPGKSTELDKISSLDTKVNDLTLDQCYMEFKDVLTDVYATVCADCDPISKWEEKYKIQDYLEVSDYEIENDECDENKCSSGILPQSEVRIKVISTDNITVCVFSCLGLSYSISCNFYENYLRITCLAYFVIFNLSQEFSGL